MINCGVEARLMKYSTVNRNEISVIDPQIKESADPQNRAVYAVVKWGRAWACFTPAVVSVLFPNFVPPQVNSNIYVNRLEQLTVLVNIRGRLLLVPITGLSQSFHGREPEYIYISRNNNSSVFENTVQKYYGIRSRILNERNMVLVGAVDVNSQSSRLLEQELVLQQKINIPMSAKRELVEYTKRQIALVKTANNLIAKMFILYLEHVNKQLSDPTQHVVNGIFIAYLKSLPNAQN